MDEKQLEELKAEGQFAINDPEAYVLSNPTPHDWTLSAQEIAQSVKINPLQFGFTKEEIEGPEKLSMVGTAAKGIWGGIAQGVDDFDSMMNVRDVEYSSPHMTEPEATRLMQDALYTRHKGREAEQELTAQKIKYNTLYDISNAVGSLIKYAGLGFLTGSPAAVGVAAGLESMASMEADMVDRYVEQTGGIEGYDKKRRDRDLGIAGSYGVFTGITESMLGIDRIAAGALGRYSTIDAASRLARIQGKLSKSALLQAGKRFGLTALEEGAEEFVQSVGEDVANYIAGYEDAVFTDQNFKKAITSAAYGAMLGGPAGWFVYRYSRKSIIDKINKMSQERNWGLTDQQIAQATDQILEESKTTMVDEIATRAEIKNHYGQAYELVKQRITEQIDATGTTPWTDKNKSKEEYITVLADSITIPAVNMANVLNIPLSEFLEIADINTATIAGNIAWLQPITSVEDIDKIIADQDAVIKQEREAKKLGVDDDTKLKRARTRKAIAERVRKEIIGEQALRTIRQNRKKETADYVTAQDLQPEQVKTLENAVQATGDQDYVLFGGIRIPVDYQVVELATIQPSHIDGTPNPAYSNVELQNRASRGTVEDVADLRQKATNITPERLMRASTSAEGAPVVNAKGEVIAGNGREEIIRYAYENPETAEKYKQELVKQGFNIEGMQQPILVRRNTTMTDQEQIAAADISNISKTSAFDNASQARRDTQYLKDSKTPVEFASKLPMSERRGLMQNNGKWNKRKVQQRYEDALLAWLCGNDTQLFENLVLDRGLSQKVINILADNGTLIYETATKYPGTELREDIYHALVKMQRATRDNFLETTQQLELDGHDVMPENIIIWNWLFTDTTTNDQFLQSYATTLANNHESVNAGEDMFGQKVAPLSKKDALIQALKKADQAKAETMAARGRNYAPLFDENGMATDVNLAAAIASYNNQFAPTSNLNQIGYASMRGELVGEYIDANQFAHAGEGPNVHGWGNYFLASKEIDKKRYFEKFDREGPNVRYNGKEVTRYLLANELKLNNGEVQDLIIYRMQDITMPKQWFIDATQNILNKARYEYERHTKAIELRFQNQLGEARVKEILNDIEKLVMGRGATTDDIAFPFAEGSEEAKIQDKYRDADGKLSEDFMEVWRGLIKEFGGDDTMTAQYPTVYQRTVADIIALRKDLEIIKNLDFDKFTGRTGMTYKGKDFFDWFVGRLREEENNLNDGYVDVLYMQGIRSMIFDNLKNILKKGGNIIDAVNKFEKENIKPWLDIKPEVKQYIKDTIAKKKDEYPDADAKAVQKFLFEFMDKTVEDKWPSDGMVYQKWYTEEASDADKKLIDAVTGEENHGIKYPGQQEDNKEIIIGLINKIRDAESNYRVSKLARKILKDTKKSDFVYKPNASMYKTDQIPENDELLDFSKKLNKQPKLVQEGLLRMIEENRQAMPFLNHFLEYQALQSWDVLDALFDVGDKQGMWNLGLMRDIAFNMMNSEPFKKDYAVRDAIADMGSRAIRYTTSQATQEGRPATVKDLISALNGAAESMLPKANGKVAFNGEEDDIYQLRDILIKRVSKHGLDTKLEDITDDIRPVEFANITGDYLFRQIDHYLYLFDDAVRILRNDPIINAPNAGAPELTSKLLLKYGIRGIRYWGKTDKRGFVTFEPTKPTELLYQKRGVIRGTYDPELQAIILTKYWNETTLVHEYHHRFLEKLWGYFKQAQTGERAVSDEFLADMDKLFQMLEIDPAQDQLTVVQQEKFATMVEAYLTGLGVDNPENLAFQSFLHWIPEQYKSIMDLGYLDENNEIQNPILDQESIDWFNKWFACPFAPSLPSAPDAQRIVNPTDETGQIVPSSQKIMNNREKEWGQDSEEQNKADAQLWRAINENTPNDMRAALDGEKVSMKAATNNLPDDTKLPEPHKPTIREKWFKTRIPDARERAADMAREYLAQNPDHARELAFADPETSTEFDAPVDRGMLIRAVMETVPHGSNEWYILNDNLATVKSMSGSTLSLSGDLSHQAYLDAKREVEAARELKAAINYAGTRRGAMDKWNSDIRAFIAQRTEALLATEPDSEERKTAIKAFLEEAKTKFSANTTDAVLNQMDLTGMKTKNSQVFIKWAEKQIKQAAHAKIDATEQKELIKASIAAQLALKEIDSTVQKDGKYTRAVQSAKDIRHWQFVKDKMKKAYIGRWGKFGIFWDNLFGSYAPSAMLMSANTLFFANVPSTAINTLTIRQAAKTIGKNNVDEATQKGEIERIRQVFNASGVNLAQMDKPTSPSTLHGEKYTKAEQSHWYDFTFEVLGRTDNLFRIPTFVDALARIATKDAGGDKTKATVLFKEYAKLNNQSDEAKIARKQALAVANMAVFTQDGTLATGLNQIRTVLNTITRVPLGLEPQGFGLGNILAPFLKTGANITEMGFDAMLAPIRTMAAGFQKLQGKEIPDIKKLALTSDWINLAWTSVMIALMAAISGDDDEWYTEPYTSGRRYDPNKPYDSIRFGNTWVKMDIFGPIAIPLRTAAMAIKEWEDKKLESIGDGIFEALSETPLVQQFTDSSLDYMSKQPGKYWSSFGYNQANKLVPAQAKSVIKATSRATGATLDTTGLGKTLDRKFHRNYGFDSARLTSNDLIGLLTNRLKYSEQ